MADIKGAAEKAAEKFEEGADWVKSKAEDAKHAIEDTARKVQTAIKGQPATGTHQGEPVVEPPL